MVLGPHLVWKQLDSHPLAVAIIDKTVPDDSYREHRGLMWVLNHLKYSQKDGTDYAFDRDYLGFFPLPDQKFRVTPIPDSLSGADLIYVADTYGVYAGEFYLKDRRGSFSSLLYGGLEEKEARTIEDAVRGGSSLIAEFNAFATPTGKEARRVLCDLLGVEWTGWIGRTFDNLHGSGEVPMWAVENYERQYGEKWNFIGPGLLFVHDDGRLVVLSTKQDLERDGITFEMESTKQRAYGAKSGLPYLYWFDIVEPVAGSTVEAGFRLHVKDAAGEKLRGAGIPATFPAVIMRNAGRRPVYYFAGDFADLRSTPLTWKLWGMEFFYTLLPMNPRIKPEVYFWNVYLPLMDHILAQISNRR